MEGSLALRGHSRSSGDIKSIDTLLLTEPFKGIPGSMTGQQGPVILTGLGEHRAEGGREGGI